MEAPVVLGQVPCKEGQVTVHRLPDRMQGCGSQPFRKSGFLEVEVSAAGEEFKPGTLVKILAPAAMYLGAVVERVSGFLIIEVDLSTEYTPL
jgi:hypothetical protein